MGKGEQGDTLLIHCAAPKADKPATRKRPASAKALPEAALPTKPPAAKKHKQVAAKAGGGITPMTNGPTATNLRCLGELNQPT